MRSPRGPAGTGRQVQARPFAFRRRAGAPAAAEVDEEVERGGGGEQRTSPAEATAHRGRKTGVLIRVHVSRDSSGMENLEEFWQDGFESLDAPCKRESSTAPGGTTRRAHSSVAPSRALASAKPCVIPSPIEEDALAETRGCFDERPRSCGGSSSSNSSQSIQRSRDLSCTSQGSSLRFSTASWESRRRQNAASPAAKASKSDSDMSLCTPSDRRSAGSSDMDSCRSLQKDRGGSDIERRSTDTLSSICGSQKHKISSPRTHLPARTPSLPDDGSLSGLLTSASLSLHSLTFSEELDSDLHPRAGSSSTSPHSSNISASASTLTNSTHASSVSDCASAVWNAVGGGRGGDVWESAGIWKEIDGGLALLNDIEPSIGQQLMSEVKKELVRMLKHHLCSRVAPAIRNQLQRFVNGKWPGLVKEKLLLVVRRQSELEWRRSRERERLFCVARNSLQSEIQQDYIFSDVSSNVHQSPLGDSPSSEVPVAGRQQSARAHSTPQTRVTAAHSLNSSNSNPSGQINTWQSPATAEDSTCSSLRGDTRRTSVASSLLHTPQANHSEKDKASACSLAQDSSGQCAASDLTPSDQSSAAGIDRIGFSAGKRQGKGVEEEEEEETEYEREVSGDGHGEARVQGDGDVSKAAADQADKEIKINFWAKCDRCQKWRHLPETMHDEVDSAELWFCTMAPGITCDDLQDPAAEREHMHDDANAESPGSRAKAEGRAGVATERTQMRQRVEASLLEEMDMIDFENEADEDERQQNDSITEGEDKSENQDDQDRDEKEQLRQRLVVAGEDDEDEERQDDESSEGEIENNADTSTDSGQKGHKRVSFASKASSDMSLCGDSSFQGSATENMENSPTDGLRAASTLGDHASPSGSFGDDGGDFDCGGGAEDGEEAQDAGRGRGNEEHFGSFLAKNKVMGEHSKKRKQGEGQYGAARCSKRRRFRVLEFWRNERVEYSRSSSAEGCDLPEIVQVILLSPEPTPFRPRKHVKKKYDKKWDVDIDDAVAAITWTDIEES